MLRVLDYIETISFGYVLYCVCFFNLYNGCFNLYCNMCVCVCVVLYVPVRPSCQILNQVHALNLACTISLWGPNRML